MHPKGAPEGWEKGWGDEAAPRQSVEVFLCPFPGAVLARSWVLGCACASKK